MEKQNKILMDSNNQEEYFNEKQYLIFETAGNNYGIDILKIGEILKPVKVTRLPNAEVEVLGVINLRGNIVPVIDVRKVLIKEYTKLTNFSRIIVCNIYNKNLGLLVEKVVEVQNLREDQLEGIEVKNFSQNYIEGVGRGKDKIFLIFNLPLLIQDYGKKEGLENALLHKLELEQKE